jgi:hypothetical protein
MKNHTPEPWVVRDIVDVYHGDKLVAWSVSQADEFTDDIIKIQLANAARIVACVNACAGIPNAALSQGIVPVHLFSAVCEQRDANRERIKELVACVTELISCAHPDRDYAELKRARSLLRSLGRM